MNRTKLVDTQGNEIKKGQIVTTFRGERVRVEHLRPPHKPSSTGHVTILHLAGDRTEFRQEVFAGVVGGKFVEA